jgi:hypothetical protein
MTSITNKYVIRKTTKSASCLVELFTCFLVVSVDLSISTGRSSGTKDATESSLLIEIERLVSALDVVTQDAGDEDPSSELFGQSGRRDD